ncbi:tetratricopeptide repeat protein [Nocardia sp. NPDC127579]|uniref:tetratricopeptide repeat protein n=1 Tax=Nocardia sp. NPDC127579 TaxID=3345402 RepID=UPI0036330AED
MAEVLRVSLERLGADCPSAVDLIRVMAWFAPEEIPDVLVEACGERPQVDIALSHLLAHQLVFRATGTVRMHRLTQTILRDTSGAESATQWRDAAIGALAALLDESSYSGMDALPIAQYRTLIRHALVVTERVPHGTPGPLWKMLRPAAELCLTFDPERAVFFRRRDLDDLKHRADQVRHTLDRYEDARAGMILQAEAFLAWALVNAGHAETGLARYPGVIAGFQDMTSPDHVDTLRARFWQAEAHQLADPTGAAALKLFESVAHDYEAILGLDHPATCWPLIGLADALLQRGEIDRATTILVNVIGSDTGHQVQQSLSPGVAAAYRTLAEAHTAGHRHEEAIRCRESLLRAAELGSDEPGPDVLAARFDLAETRAAAGDVAGALALYRAIQDDTDQQYGPDSGASFVARSALASLAMENAQAQGTARLMDTVLPFCQQMLGSEPFQAYVERLGYREKFELSGIKVRAAIAMAVMYTFFEELFGADLVFIRELWDGLATALITLRDFEAAVPVLEKIVAERRRALGAAAQEAVAAERELEICRCVASGEQRAAIALAESAAVELEARADADYDTLVRAWHMLAALYSDEHAQARRALTEKVAAYQLATAAALRNQPSPDLARLDSVLQAAGQNLVAADPRRLPTLEALVEVRLRRYGEQHIETLDAQMTLTVHHMTAGDIAAAESLATHIRTVAEPVHGADSRPVQLAVGWLKAIAFRKSGTVPAGTVSDLIAWMRHCESSEGSESPHSLAARIAVGGAYMHSGQLAEARDWLTTTAAECRRVLGESHRTTAMARRLLAVAYWWSSDFRTAAEMLESLIAEVERSPGADDLELAYMRGDLAQIYIGAGQPAPALAMLIDVETVIRHRLGADAEQTITVKGVLAEAYLEIEDGDRALPLLIEAVAGQTNILGPDHRSTLHIRGMLAEAIGLTAGPNQELEQVDDLLADCRRVLGETDKDTLLVHRHRAMAMLRMGERAALALLEELLAEFDREFGSADPRTLGCRVRYAQAVAKFVGRPAGIDLMLDVLTDCQRLFGVDHPHTEWVRKQLREVS